MLLDEQAALIEPKKGKREAPLPSLCLLIFTLQDLDLFLRSFPNPPKRTHKIFLTNVYTGSLEGIPIALAGPVLGAPQAVLVVEKLIALGVRDVLALGWCGSLQPRVHIGDVILPSGALSEEGTSRHYPLALEEAGPSPEILRPLRESFQEGELTLHEGKVWSTDAPYRETPGKVLAYRKQGLLAVDMEVSALFTVARFRGIRLGASLIVSDDLSSLKWVHGFKEARFQQARASIVELTLKAMESFAGSSANTEESRQIRVEDLQ